MRDKLDLEEKSPKWKGNSDTETILAYIEAYGFENAIKQFVGMFVFALWDKKLSSLILVRDRIGESLYIMDSKVIYLFLLQN